jgi:hypothetical protein
MSISRSSSIFVSSIVFLALISGCAGKEAKNKNGLYGEVISSIECKYEMKEGEKKATESVNEKILTTYDANQNITLMTRYDGSGNIIEEITYNDLGKKKTENVYGPTGSISQQKIYEYDDVGRLRNERSILDGKLEYEIIHEFDSVGNEITMSKYGGTGNILEQTVFEYNYDNIMVFKGRLIDGLSVSKKEKIKDAIRNMVDKTDYYGWYIRGASWPMKSFSLYRDDGKISYDLSITGDGPLTREYTYNPDGTLGEISTHHEGDSIGGEERYSKEVYKYDKKGNILHDIEHDALGRLSDNYHYKYDRDGNVTQKKSYNGKKELLSKETWQYDLRGNCTVYSTFLDFGFITTPTYIEVMNYDKRGNITNAEVVKNNPLFFLSIFSRKFRLYKTARTTWSYRYRTGAFRE